VDKFFSYLAVDAAFTTVLGEAVKFLLPTLLSGVALAKSAEAEGQDTSS
jgi:hypothetical protein